MLLLVAMALMTGAAVLAALWPLSRRSPPSHSEGNGDLGFYRDQLAEIDREIERGLISPGEANAARAEAGRRLIRAGGEVQSIGVSEGEPALRRRRAAAAFSLSIVPLIGLAVYGALGSPQLSSGQGAGQGSGAALADMAALIGQVERHLATRPEDGRGWDVIAPVYLRAGRYDDAAKAFAAARRLEGETVDRLTGYGEALVAAAGGVVSADAGAAFARALAIDPGSAKARFFVALGLEQDGELSRARAAYERILADAPGNAPWRPVVEGRLARLSNSQNPASASLPAEAVTPEIRAMVEGLDARLQQGGGTEAEWARLIRSYAVLGRPEDALDRLGKAKIALADDQAARGSLDRLAQELGLLKREASR